jgi:putative flippase GtrA
MHRKQLTSSIMLRIVSDRRFRYLAVGGWNALFSYGATLVIYSLLSPYAHIIVIATISNIAAITMSFSTNKLFVFRSKGDWLKEYLRSYVVYGGNILVGILGLWLLADILGVPVWVAQGLLVAIGVAVAYIGHQKFTFRSH